MICFPPHVITKATPLVLASGSPRRRELLASAGVPFKVVVSDVDEQPVPGESAELMVRRLAEAKARAVAELHVAEWVLGADTTVVLNGRIFGKPDNPVDACAMLQALQGKRHTVLGGIALVHHAKNVASVEVHATEVDMIALTEVEIQRYVASGEPMDKAGAYAIQGLGTQLVAAVYGSYSNVVGLNLAATIGMLRRACVFE